MMSRDEQHERNKQVIEMIRANGANGTERPTLILTTTGARSGKPFSTPLSYLREGDRLLVFASNYAAPRAPDWYYNLVANPEVTIELLGENFAAQATTLDGEALQSISAWLNEAWPGRNEYEARAGRAIPVVELKRV